jgi:hypothetical protein
VLINLLIMVVIIAVIFYVLSLIPLGQPWINIIRIIVGLIVLIWLLNMLGAWGPTNGPLWRH